MPLTYTRALTVAAGDTVGAREVASLARAMNDRLKLGPSCPWRLVFAVLSAFRSMRNPDGFLTPDQGEFFSFYQTLDPKNATWPETAPAEPAGANVSSQWPGFIFGRAGARVPDESSRLSDPTEGGLDIDAGDGSAEALWALHKRQCGAADPNTRASGCPAREAATGQFYLNQGRYSPHGKTYGEWFAGPSSAGFCADPGPDLPWPQNWQIVFTNRIDASTLTYGSCPENPDDVARVLYAPDAYVISLNSGAVRVLTKTDWIEGPYTENPQLGKLDSEYLARSLDAFAGEFRGTAEQRATGGWLAAAADKQRFLTTQYLLAPQLGVQLGATGVAPLYPVLRLNSPASNYAAAGAALAPVGGTGAGHRIHAEFVCGIVLARATGLHGPATVRVSRDGVELGVITLTPDAAGAAAAIGTFERPANGGLITAALADAASWRGGGGRIEVELGEQFARKPSALDWALLLRIGAVDFTARVDGAGADCDFARELAEDYHATGAIRSHDGHIALPGSTAEINTNAVFEAGRQISKCVRIIPRFNFTGIAVVGGKTVLWCSRYARGSEQGNPIDLFDGIGPAPGAIASGALVWGRTYIVRGLAGAAISYRGREYALAETFTAAQGTLEFISRRGGEVWEAEGIRALAEPQGWSNRWLCGLNTTNYRDNEASVWKPSAFADILPIINSALFGDPAIADDRTLTNHMAYGQRTTSPLAVITPEAPDSLNYTPVTVGSAHYTRANYQACDDADTACRALREKFYRARRVFEPWPEIASVTRDGDDLKLVLNRRIHHDPDAPVGDWSRDPAGWDRTALADEESWSWENALRRYILWDRYRLNFPIKIGDQAMHSPLPEGLDAPLGAIMPRMFLTQLIPEPYARSAGDPYEFATPSLHDIYRQLSLYVDTCCEGFGDAEGSLSLACAHDVSDWYCYSTKTLWQSVNGGRNAAPVAYAVTPLTALADTRPDVPAGFGQGPTIRITADLHNQFATALNRLVHIPVRLPMALEYRTGTATGLDDVNSVVVNSDGTLASGSGWSFGGASFAVWLKSGPGAVGAMSYDAWSELTTVTGPAAYWGLRNISGTHDIWRTTSTQVVQYRWAGLADSTAALPDEFSGLLSTSPGILMRIHTVSGTIQHDYVAGAFAGQQCHAGGGSDGNFQTSDATRSSVFPDMPLRDETVCRLILGGQIASGSAPAGVAWAVDSAPDVNPNNYCSGDPSISVTAEPLAASTPVITVPLV